MDPETSEALPQEDDSTTKDVASLLKAIEEKEAKLVAMERKRRANSLSSTVVVLVGSLVGVFATTYSSYIFDVSRVTLNPGGNQSRSRFNQLDARLRRLESSADKPRVLSNSTSGQATTEIAKDVESLKNRVNSLSTAILASPERAIAIPLLRKDIDGISKRMEEYRIQGKSEIDRLYEQQ